MGLYQALVHPGVAQRTAMWPRPGCHGAGAVTRMPGHNHQARSPRMPGLALRRIGPPARPLRHAHDVLEHLLEKRGRTECQASRVA
jgi:hypothetical protein